MALVPIEHLHRGKGEGVHLIKAHTDTNSPQKPCDSDQHQDSLGHAATAAWERLPLCEDSDGMSTDACLRYGAADIDTDIRYRFILSLEWRTPAGGWLNSLYAWCLKPLFTHNLKL